MIARFLAVVLFALALGPARAQAPLTLVDDETTVSTAYGSWGEKKLYGRTSIGMTRSTFVIGPDGVLTKVWKRARAADHGEAVLKVLRA